MPNICHNRLEIIAPEHEADEFVALVTGKDDDIDFTRLVPQPEDIGEGWYDWRHQHWGTKWINDVQWNGNAETPEGRCYLSYAYDSAWAPLNTEFWTAVAQRFPGSIFVTSYNELGMGFVGGMAVADGGSFVHDQTLNVDDMPDAPVYPAEFSDLDAEYDWHDRYWVYAMDLQGTMHEGAKYQALSAVKEAQ